MQALLPQFPGYIRITASSSLAVLSGCEVDTRSMDQAFRTNISLTGMLANESDGGTADKSEWFG
jgi:allantoicase